MRPEAVWNRLADIHRAARRGSAALALLLAIAGLLLMALGMGMGGDRAFAAVATGAMALALALLPWHVWLEHGEREAGLRTLAEEWEAIAEGRPDAAARVVALLRHAYGTGGEEGTGR